jgi:hypothetical protein
MSRPVAAGKRELLHSAWLVLAGALAGLTLAR